MRTQVILAIVLVLTVVGGEGARRQERDGEQGEQAPYPRHGRA